MWPNGNHIAGFELARTTLSQAGGAEIQSQ
jgi:hypothetical protein